jgi:hypothetical protein
MIRVEPATLGFNGVRLEPLSLAHLHYKLGQHAGQ